VLIKPWVSGLAAVSGLADCSVETFIDGRTFKSATPRAKKRNAGRVPPHPGAGVLPGHEAERQNRQETYLSAVSFLQSSLQLNGGGGQPSGAGTNPWVYATENSEEPTNPKLGG
jgi:hypothetical protein